MSTQVLNNSTKQIEEITLGNVEELLGASSEVHSNDLDILDMILYVRTTTVYRMLLITK
jgi:hypothetical protein